VRRRLYTERWFLRLVMWMLPVGVIATIGGWVVSVSVITGAARPTTADDA
jgi:cytochrome bd-type quinol oxidase subunit 1